LIVVEDDVVLNVPSKEIGLQAAFSYWSSFANLASDPTTLMKSQSEALVAKLNKQTRNKTQKHQTSAQFQHAHTTKLRVSVFSTSSNFADQLNEIESQCARFICFEYQSQSMLLHQFARRLHELNGMTETKNDVI
jgi:Tfp pilus assembly pilus retraction ATPase PilT